MPLLVAGLSREIPCYIPPGGVKVHRQRSPRNSGSNIWHLRLGTNWGHTTHPLPAVTVSGRFRQDN